MPGDPFLQPCEAIDRPRHIHANHKSKTVSRAVPVRRGSPGLYSTCLLEQLEARAGEPLGWRFDLIAGTSIGGILAIALAFEVPMSTLRTLFLERGKDIFPTGGDPSGAISRVLDFARSALGPKYSGEPFARRCANISATGRWKKRRIMWST